MVSDHGIHIVSIPKLCYVAMNCLEEKQMNVRFLTKISQLLLQQRFFKAPSVLHSRVGTEKTLTLQERETKASLAKAGVRRRRGPRTQVLLHLTG